MHERFQQIIDRMEPLLVNLMESPPIGWDDRKRLPIKGVYVFYEEGNPIYVGRSNRIPQRIREHGSDSSRKESATFALKLLRKKLGLPGGHNDKYTRTQLQEKYGDEYRAQRELIRSMEIRAVEIADQRTQAIFESYAILALGTDGPKGYNDFHTT